MVFLWGEIMIKTHVKGSDKNYLATCSKCNSDVIYSGNDINGGENGVQPYIECSECEETIFHEYWNARRYKREIEGIED